MKERPILFSAPMIKAILCGAKSQTRRAVKPQPADYPALRSEPRAGANWIFMAHSDRPGYAFAAGDVRCPYGVAGDVLWCRETWAAPHDFDHLPPRLILPPRFHYLADEERGGLLWRPSIHMPRWASRITLEVTEVRVERLAEISETDCIAEGCPGGHAAIRGYAYSATPLEHYRHVWESINGKGSWDASPWVWVVSFKRAI